MSGECYFDKNSNAVDVGSLRQGNTAEKLNKQHQDNFQNVQLSQLLEYESLVTSAENKCTELKGQLEHFKHFYSSRTEAKKKPIPKRQTFASKSTRAKFGITSVVSRESNSFKPKKIIRQNSDAIHTDKTGAALNTINNILVGITKSMQSSEFQNYVKAKKSTSNEDNAPLYGVEAVKINSKSKNMVHAKSVSKLKPKKIKSKIASKSSSTNFKKLKKLNQKFLKTINAKNSSDNKQDGVVQEVAKPIKKRAVKPQFDAKSLNSAKFYARTTDLVELYHNQAVKPVQSSDSDMPKMKAHYKPKINVQQESNSFVVPPLKMIEDKETNELNNGLVGIYKNYTTPTVSSRMKQVAKYYMNSFNIKTIPFCPVISTSPSHNIGINIQQVMSMVKTRQPSVQLSPTLAYNIGLAAEKCDENTLPLLGLTTTARTICSHCPLSRSTINYHHLQEIAKTVPQETIEEKDETEETTTSPETLSVFITGPSGDVKVKNRKQTIWTANVNDEKKCTCIPNKGLDFQQIIKKFNANVPSSKTNMNVVSNNINKKKSTILKTGEDATLPCKQTPLQNKEQKLKEVLKKLHDDFDNMTKTYDNLAKKTEDGTASPKTIEELEKLDKELTSKEEEIVMVMTLYKEVLALKQQVQTLKKRTSKENVSMVNHATKFNSYNNLQTAGLLNKLLEKIQDFQGHYKKR